MRSSHISLLIAFLLSSISLFAQAPQSINYQAMAFNGTTVYANQTFDVRFTLHLNNTTIYEEVHPSTTSNTAGLFVLKIGEGVPSSGIFSAIDWSAGPYSLKTELDPGSGYVLISDHTFSSVPYALFAERAALPVAPELEFNGDTLQIAQNGATLGQILKWNGQEWVPDFDAANNYAAGTGINVSGSVISNTGDTDPTDDITTASNAGGDVSGLFSNLTVVGIQGFPVSNTAPANNDVLKWNASTSLWEAKPEVITGGGASNVTARLSGDGTIGSPLDIAQNGATAGQILKWNDVSSAWAPANDTVQAYGLQLVGNTLTLVPDGSTSTVSIGNQYNAGPGINLVGGTIANTGDIDGSDDITTSTTAGGDVNGTFPTLTVGGLQGNPISATIPSTGEVLSWNGTEWVPATVIGTTINAGPGINLVGSTIVNTGDIDPNDDITTSTVAGGDLNGLYPNPSVNGLAGFPLSSQSPALNQVLKFNGTTWVPDTDDDTDADADPTNEIQSLAITGGNISISGSNSVQLPIYFEGAGVDITNNVITNTGDTDASDDITTATSAAGDVSGTFPTLTVDGLQGYPVATNAPASGEVLKWNGTQWAPAADANFLVAGGDLSGVYPNPEVTKIHGFSVANTTPLIGQVYKWNGSQWIPSDEGTGPWSETAGNAVHDGDIFLQNGSGQTRVAAGISPNDRGYINVYDEFNNLKAGIQINASGQGEVFGDSKTFRMEHPEDPNKEIWYANLEGPEAGAYTRGTAELINGTATISFPEHFQLIATAENMTIMLTPLSGDSEGLAVIEKTTNGFVVRELRNGNGNYRFDWEAKCIRQGFENFEVIRDRK